MADLLTKRERCIRTRKHPVMFLISNPFVSFLFQRTHLTVLRGKNILGFCLPSLQTGSRNCDIKDQFVAAYNSDLLSKSNESKKMVIKC